MFLRSVICCTDTANHCQLIECSYLLFHSFQLVEASTLKKEVAEGVDVMVVRELTGGLVFMLISLIIYIYFFFCDTAINLHCF